MAAKKLMPVTIRLPPSLIQWLVERKAETGCTFQRLVTDALDQARKHETDKDKSQMDPGNEWREVIS